MGRSSDRDVEPDQNETTRSGGREGKYRDSFEVTSDDTMDSAVRIANIHDIPKR